MIFVIITKLFRNYSINQNMLELVKNSLTISYNYLKKNSTVPFFLISSSVMIYSFFSLEFLINYFSKNLNH